MLRWKRKIRNEKNGYVLTLPKAVGESWRDDAIHEVDITYDGEILQIMPSLPNNCFKMMHLKDF